MDAVSTAQATATESRATSEPHFDDDAAASSQDAAPLLEEELLVEEVSIDGMCGVY